MESDERRDLTGTSEDREQGTPQDRLVGDDPTPDESDERVQGDAGSPQEGGAESAADAGRLGG